MPSKPTHVQPSEHVLAQELNGELVLLHLKNGEYYGLDDVGTRMWHLLVAHGTVEGAQAALLEEYDVDPAVLRRDLEQLIARLAEHDLIQVEAPAPARKPAAPRPRTTA